MTISERADRARDRATGRSRRSLTAPGGGIDDADAMAGTGGSGWKPLGLEGPVSSAHAVTTKARPTIVVIRQKVERASRSAIKTLPPPRPRTQR